MRPDNSPKPRDGDDAGRVEVRGAVERMAEPVFGSLVAYPEVEVAIAVTDGVRE